MLSKLRIILNGTDRLNVNQSSCLHGFMMENMDPHYAKKLHEDGFKPYSQGVYFDDKGFYWEVCTLTKEAYSNIIQPLKEIQTIRLRKANTSYDVLAMEETVINKKDFFPELLFQSRAGNVFTIQFLTPTAFKSEGKYVNLPSVRHIFQSVLLKLDATSEDYQYFSKDLLLDLEGVINFHKYRLQSSNFHLESQKVPAFKGEISFRVNGPQQIKNLCQLLFTFAQFSGIGIKCGLGMGKVRMKGDVTWIKKSIK